MMKLSLLEDAPGLDEPLEMLDACHGRIKAQIATLHRLVAHLPQHGADEQARKAAEKVIRYFTTAAENHHTDEEVDLFPALLNNAGDERESVQALVNRLLADHVAMGKVRTTILRTLSRIEGGENVPLARSDVDAMDKLYSEHIECETSELFPLAVRLLSVDDIKRLSRAMAERRGVPV